MGPPKLRILHLSDLHEAVELDWMDDKDKARIRATIHRRADVLGDSFRQRPSSDAALSEAGPAVGIIDAQA